MKRQSNSIDYVELPAASADSITKVRAFYSGVFEWEFQMWGDTYADTKSSGIGVGINGDASNKSKSPLAVIHCTDIEATRKRVVDAGGTITREIFSFPGGRRFHFLDPDGNELAVWSET